ncbi:hypothetical protein [Streptomyces sp. KLOTTS4A1]|uniref:hypothetical protein n=1 Tax=Streptomyces sp. KLOTTS4A1 TaxID=3390996 RepID=UPI0039F5F4C4
MLRHAIPPARFFTQVPNEILRHPRLSSDAVRLLTWQLSLPEGDNAPLSKTADQAGVKRGAFARAKEQLKAEGYLHEWREQCGRGRWATRQLVSNVPLSAAEAATVRDGGGGTVLPDAPAAPDAPDAPAEPCAPSAPDAPTAPPPAVGEPTPRAVGGHPSEYLLENTSNPPAAAATEAASEAAREAASAATAPAADLIGALRELDGRLRIPRAMTAELTAHVDAWLAAGHTLADVREHIAYGLPSPGRPVFRPGGLLRYLLKDVPPVRAHEEPRVAAMRECTGETHLHPRLFRPVTTEALCPDCRTAQAADSPARTTAVRGAASVRAALRGC